MIKTLDDKFTSFMTNERQIELCKKTINNFRIRFGFCFGKNKGIVIYNAGY